MDQSISRRTLLRVAGLTSVSLTAGLSQEALTSTLPPAAAKPRLMAKDPRVVDSASGLMGPKHISFRTEPPAHYGWLPPAQLVGGGKEPRDTVPPGYIQQTAFQDGGGPDLRGVYTTPSHDWSPIVWRWADTNRVGCIRRVTRRTAKRPTGFPTYRFEVAPTDRASGGTAGNAPRAELFSVDPGEKRGQRRPPDGGVVRTNQEYWATFAIRISKSFPENHKWATLFQRKRPDNVAWQWFSLNVHGDMIDVSLPGPEATDYVPVTTLAELKGRWVQFTVHEVLKTGAGGLVEVYLNRDRKVLEEVHGSVPGGDLGFHFQYGYYRTNDPKRPGTEGPGVGIVHYTPLLIRRGPLTRLVPALP
jgi:hypothetical protein